MHLRDRQYHIRRPDGGLLSIVAAFLCLVCLPLASGAGSQPSPTRVAVLFGAQKSYRHAAALLEAKLRSMGFDCVGIELPGPNDKPGRAEVRKQLSTAKPALIATAGRGATSFALDEVPHTPVVFFMVPNARDAPFVKGNNPRKRLVAGVTTDVSPRDQADWIARLCPTATGVAVLHSSRTKRTVEALRTAAEKRGITITAVDADKAAFPKAIEALKAQECAGVLMIPDARVYNAATIKRLLLWGLRQKKPVWTFSANIVKAGALAGVYSDRDKTVQQTADLIQKVVSSPGSAKIGLQYPKEVRRAVNQHTAEMIGVRIDGPAVNSETVIFGEEP